VPKQQLKIYKMRKLNTTTFPVLETERLVLRQVNKDDVNEVFFLRSSTEVGKYIARDPQKNINETIAFIEKTKRNMNDNKAIPWAITFKNNDKLIGTLSLHSFSEENTVAEIGYDLSPEFQKKGIMSEALKAVISYGFQDLQLLMIEAFTQIENESSKLLLVKNKFQLHPTRVDEGFPKNIIYELHRENY